MKSKKIVFFGMLVLLIFGMFNMAFATAELPNQNRVILEKHGSRTVKIYVETTKEASIASFQMGFTVDDPNFKEKNFKWNSTLKKNADLTETTFDSDTKTLRIYYVGQNELNNDNYKFEVGTLEFTNNKSKAKTITITPIQEMTSASSIAHTSKDIYISAEEDALTFKLSYTGPSSSNNDEEDEDDNIQDEDKNEEEESKVTVNYSDVEKSKWYYESIKYVSEKQLMNGVGNNMFEPNGLVTRGMMITILYRLSNEKATYTSKFTDVEKSKYYADAVTWGAENGIVSGVGDNKFEPDRAIKREEMAAMILRYIQKMNLKLPVVDSSNINYNDNSEISSYAIGSIQEMKKTGIMQGKDGNKFDPKGSATRAEAATILMRILESI